jgi:perosamine synthetase
MIKLANPDITSKEMKAVLKVLKSGTLSLGPELIAFEKEFAAFIGRRYALAVSSGTAGLHMAVSALDIGPGHEVITSPYSFIASVNCIIYRGAKPVLADIDPKTLNIDPEKVAKKITRYTKAILPVDVFGLPVDFEHLMGIAKKNGLYLIEDSCEALGAEYHGKKCGSFGKVSAFGFYPNKQITTGEGGMVLCDDRQLYQRMTALRNQGRITMGGWLAHHMMGYNYRMSDISAALGRIQLSRLPGILIKRRRIAENYKMLFAKHLPEFSVLEDFSGTVRSWFVFVVMVPHKLKGRKRDLLIQELHKRGIQCAHYFPALHLQPALRHLDYKPGDFPVAEDVADRSLALPFHNKLKAHEQQKVVDIVKQLV